MTVSFATAARPMPHAVRSAGPWLFGRDVTPVGPSLPVEQRSGSRVGCMLFAADRVHVEPAGGQGALLQLGGQGQRMRIGRFLRTELRGALARERRQTLRRASVQAGSPIDPN